MSSLEKTDKLVFTLAFSVDLGEEGSFLAVVGRSVRRALEREALGNGDSKAVVDLEK
jgi:hypothetical protein